MKKPFFGAVVCALLVAMALSASAQTAEIKTIDAYCKTVDALTKKTKSPELVFADVSDYEANAKAKWQRFASEKALDKHREKTEAYTIAYAWRKNGKIAASNFTYFSPSGDWTKYVFSYFREDGTLAKAAIDYRTFQGDLIVLQDLYFDKSGKLLKKKTRFRDLSTNKPKKATKDFMGASDLSETDYYKTTKKLPFAHLIGK